MADSAAAYSSSKEKPNAFFFDRDRILNIQCRILRID